MASYVTRRSFGQPAPGLTLLTSLLVCCAALGAVGCKKQRAAAAAASASASSSAAPPVASAAGYAAPPPTEEPRGPIHLQLREKADLPTFSMVAEEFRRCPVRKHYEPAPGFEKVAVRVQIDGKPGTNVSVNPFYARLVDGSGTSYSLSYAGCEPALKSLRLEGEQSATGWLSFEVPANAASLELRYRPFLAQGGSVELIYHLGR